MTENEVLACASMVQAILVHGYRVPEHSAAGTPVPGGSAQAIFEEADELLRALGVFAPDGGRLVLAVAYDETERHIRETDANCLEDVLQSFVYVTFLWAGDLPSTREPFPVPEGVLGQAVLRLIPLGYAEEVGGAARWTDRIARVMFEAGAWTDEGEARVDNDARYLERCARHLLGKFQPDSRDELRRIGHNPLLAAAVFEPVLSDDDNWPDDWRVFDTTSADFVRQVTRRIVEIVQSEGAG